jgi:hypothetical protein
MRCCYIIFLVFSQVFAYQQITLHGPQLSSDLMQKLIEDFKVDILIETGTWGGETARKASPLFREVYTVELSHELFQQVSPSFNLFLNIHAFEAHSPVFLKEILPKLEGRILFWLDAHWCGDHTARLGKNTPIKEELEAIRESGLKNGIILIDDVRCFHNLPEEVIGYGGYPTIHEIKQLILSINPDYEFWLLGDMAIAFPKQYNQDISPLVYACTVSRLFLPTDGDDLEVVAAEQLFRKYCNAPESRAIDFLQCLVIPSTEFITFHLILWKGLLELGRQNFSVAAECFEKVLNNGYRHSRIYLYLAEAKQGMDNIK